MRSLTVLMLRYLWAAPATALGLAAAGVAVLAGARCRWVAGTVEVAGPAVERFARRLPRGCRFDAITVGHVVLGRSHAALASLRTHEQVHVRQYERWGLLFFPAYLASSAWQWLCGRDPYLHNRFEREAFRIAGGPGRAPAAESVLP